MIIVYKAITFHKHLQNYFFVMKLAVILLALAAYTSAEVRNVVPNFNTAYGYLTKYGIPEAKRIKIAEDEYLRKNPLWSRIAGGSPASSGQFKYQAGLISDIVGRPERGVCGGSLLTNNRVLTAAHCWYDGRNQAYQFTVVLGSEMLYHGGNRILSSDVVMHRLWIPLLIMNDVAIIRLPEPVAFSDTIGPIALPSGLDVLNNFNGQVATASGYGLTGDDATISNGQFLSFVNMSVISNEVCNIAYFGNIRDSNVCTSTSGKRSTCPGDSGGPLVVQRREGPVLIGITSFGIVFGCEVGWPAVFARVTSFLGFINNNL